MLEMAVEVCLEVTSQLNHQAVGKVQFLEKPANQQQPRSNSLCIQASSSRGSNVNRAPLYSLQQGLVGQAVFHTEVCFQTFHNGVLMEYKEFEGLTLL